MADMHYFWIVCTHPDAPTPDSLIEALHYAGHHAVLVQIRPSLDTALTIEMLIGSNSARAFVEISEDFQKGIDLSTSDWEMVNELVEPQEADSIRRLVQVRAWDFADRQAVQCLVKTLCLSLQGRLLC